MKNIIKKVTFWAMSAMPAVVAAVLVINCNSTASLMNGQPTPPSGLKKYRKF